MSASSKLTTKTGHHSKSAPKTDEWGEPLGKWKTIIDFRKINPNGVPAVEVLEALDRAAKEDNQRGRPGS